MRGRWLLLGVVAAVGSVVGIVALIASRGGIDYQEAGTIVMTTPGGSSTPGATPSPTPGVPVQYNPPKPEDAPQEIRDAVMLGYHIIADTQTYAKQYVGNKLNCSSCHFNAGINQDGKNGSLSLVGVAAKYPRFRTRENYSDDLVERTQQ